MRLNQTEQKGFDYIVDNLFTPVVDEYDGKIESLLEQNQELKTKVEQKLERIRKNRLLKKAVKSEMISFSEDKNTFSEEVIMNVIGRDRDELKENEHALRLTTYNSIKKLTEYQREYSETTLFSINIRMDNSHIQIGF